MKSLLVVTAAFLLVIAFLAALLQRLGLLNPSKPELEPDPREPSPFRRRDYLLSKGEAAFYQQLRLALPAGTVLIAKVRLIDLLYFPKGAKNRQSWTNRVQSKHIDFVICDAADLRPRLAIELDDKSHDREDRKERDGLVDHVLQSAGLPLHRERAAPSYSAGRLRAALAARLSS